MLIYTLTASASNAGTSADPLITLSYLNNTFAISLKSEMSRVLSSVESNASKKLNELYEQYAGYSFTPSYMRLSLSTGDSVSLPMGGSFILISGSATLTATSGDVINISTGQVVSAGSLLTQNNRYFSTENTVATITINNASIGQVDGYYLVNSADPNNQHSIFNDVLVKDWYFTAIDFVYTKGLFQGTTSSVFSPNASMTRAMFVTVLYRLENRPAAGIGGQFSDVQNSEVYYYDAVTWASANNIVLGYSEGTFRPNAPVTREQMAAIMYRYSVYLQRDMSFSEYEYDVFPDSGNTSEFAVDAMRWAVSWGVINGSNGRLLPRDTATRAQVAQIMFNYITMNN
jgi:hypothetical protein